MLHSDGMQVERETQRGIDRISAGGMYAPAGMYERVFRQLKPRTPTPEIVIEVRKYANANAQVQLLDGRLRVRMADTLAGAPPDVQEALAEILLSKLFRKPTPPAANDRYRRYL